MLALILACALDSPADGNDPSATDPAANAEPCEARTWFIDADGDGVGVAEIEACEAPGGAVSVGGDCDDADPTLSPDAIEACDGVRSCR